MSGYTTKKYRTKNLLKSEQKKKKYRDISKLTISAGTQKGNRYCVAQSTYEVFTFCSYISHAIAQSIANFMKTLWHISNHVCRWPLNTHFRPEIHTGTRLQMNMDLINEYETKLPKLLNKYQAKLTNMLGKIQKNLNEYIRLLET